MGNFVVHILFCTPDILRSTNFSSRRGGVPWLARGRWFLIIASLCAEKRAPLKTRPQTTAAGKNKNSPSLPPPHKALETPPPFLPETAIPPAPAESEIQEMEGWIFLWVWFFIFSI